MRDEGIENEIGEETEERMMEEHEMQDSNQQPEDQIPSSMGQLP